MSTSPEQMTDRELLKFIVGSGRINIEDLTDEEIEIVTGESIRQRGSVELPSGESIDLVDVNRQPETVEEFIEQQSDQFLTLRDETFIRQPTDATTTAGEIQQRVTPPPAPLAPERFKSVVDVTAPGGKRLEQIDVLEANLEDVRLELDQRKKETGIDEFGKKTALKQVQDALDSIGATPITFEEAKTRFGGIHKAFLDNFGVRAIRFLPELIGSAFSQNPVETAKDFIQFPLDIVVNQPLALFGKETSLLNVRSSDFLDVAKSQLRDIPGEKSEAVVSQFFEAGGFDQFLLFLGARGLLKKGEAKRTGVEELDTPKEVVVPKQRVPEIPLPIRKPKPVVPGEAIGLNKKEIAAISERLPDVKELPPANRKGFEESLSEAKAQRLDESALDLADEINSSKNPRLISETEHAGMLLKAVELIDEHTASMKEVSQLLEKGDRSSAQDASGRAERVIERLNKIVEASDNAGREIARALSIRRMRIFQQTYDLASVKQRARGRKGKRLDEKENAKYEDLVNRLEVSEKSLTGLEVKHQKELAEINKKLAEGVTRQEVIKARVVVRQKGQRVSIINQRSAAKNRLKELGFRVNEATGVTIEAALEIGKIAVSYIKEGLNTLEAVTKQVIKDLPELTATDVHQALIARNPKAQKRARSEAAERVAFIKSHAKLLLDIEKAFKGIFEVKEGRAPTLEPVRSLQKQLAKLRRESRSAIPESGKLERALEIINKLQDQLINHYSNVKAKRKPSSEELTELRQTTRDLQTELNLRNENLILQDQLRTGEFVVRPGIGRPIRTAPLKIEKARVLNKRLKKQIDLEIEAQAPPTATGIALEGFNIFRTLQATGEFSGIGRQGLIAIVTNPKAVPQAFVDALKATFNENKFEAIDSRIKEMDVHYLRERAGVEFSDINGRAGKREEFFANSLIERVPGLGQVVRASSRHMVTFLNMMRAAHFDRFVEMYPNATRAELKAWADWVNITTGRGRFQVSGGTALFLSAVFFAPRFAISRVQTPLALVRHWKNPRVRKEIMKDMGKTLAVGATALGLAKLAGFEVGINPRDSDWGKIVIGKTRIDLWAGFQQPMRIVYGSIARAGQDLPEELNILGFGEGLSKKERDFNAIESFMRFVSYKASPGVVLTSGFISGEDIFGRQHDRFGLLGKALLPLAYKDIYDAWVEEGAEMSALVAPLVFIGVGVNTFEKKKRRSKKTPGLELIN